MYNYIATLEIWSVSDGELFYVMSHKKDQPGQKRFATLPGIDHDIGILIMQIISIYFQFLLQTLSSY